MELWTTGCSRRSYALQGCWMLWPLRVPSNPGILWCTMVRFHSPAAGTGCSSTFCQERIRQGSWWGIPAEEWPGPEQPRQGRAWEVHVALHAMSSSGDGPVGHSCSCVSSTPGPALPVLGVLCRPEGLGWSTVTVAKAESTAGPSTPFFPYTDPWCMHTYNNICVYIIYVYTTNIYTKGYIYKSIHWQNHRNRRDLWRSSNQPLSRQGNLEQATQESIQGLWLSLEVDSTTSPASRFQCSATLNVK